jgi:hypothetical protein
VVKKASTLRIKDGAVPNYIQDRSRLAETVRTRYLVDFVDLPLSLSRLLYMARERSSLTEDLLRLYLQLV